jgi:hypothetical protein
MNVAILLAFVFILLISLKTINYKEGLTSQTKYIKPTGTNNYVSFLNNSKFTLYDFSDISNITIPNPNWYFLASGSNYYVGTINNDNGGTINNDNVVVSTTSVAPTSENIKTTSYFYIRDNIIFTCKFVNNNPNSPYICVYNNNNNNNIIWIKAGQLPSGYSMTFEKSDT